MYSGSTILLPITLALDIDLIDKVIFTLKGADTVTKEYPDDVSFNDKTFLIPLTQEDTIALCGGANRCISVQAQINYTSKAVVQTDVSKFFMYSSLATEIVEGNTPANNIVLEDLVISVVEGVIIINGGNGGSSTGGGLSESQVRRIVEAYNYATKAEVANKITLSEVEAFFVAHKDELKGDPGADGINGADGRDGADGVNGRDGQDYVITASDYDAIADVVLTKISSAEGVTF